MLYTDIQTLLLAATSLVLIILLGFVIRRKAQDNRQHEESKHLLMTIFDSSDETIAMFERDGTLRAINRIGAERLHSTPKHMVGMPLTAFIPPEIAGPRLAAIRRVADSGTSEVLIDRCAGHIYRQTFYPIKGEQHRVVVYAADITEKLAAEKALAESEDKFRTIFDSINDAIFVHDAANGRILDVNASACRMYSYSREELLDLDVARISAGIAPYTMEAAREYIRLCQETEWQAFEWRARDSNDRLFWVAVNLRMLKLSDGQRILAVVRNIDSRKHAEEDLKRALAEAKALNVKLAETQSQLLQSEKMASIGQLAAGVAHELNNPIGFVNSNLGTLKTYLDDIFLIIDAYEKAICESGIDCIVLDAVHALQVNKDFAYLRQDVFQLLGESSEGLQRVRKIVQDLKDFSRPGETDWQWADLQSGLESTLNIVWNELKYKCTVKKDYQELPPVRCLPSQLNQVFMNLLVNAAHAIETQGEIVIATRRLDEDKVQISIADNGKGVAPEHMNHLFEPFFTTKPVGQGTGLGLSIVWGIINKHHGKIEVVSTIGKGTTFTVTLPIDPPQDEESIAVPINTTDTAAAVPPAPTFTTS